MSGRLRELWARHRAMVLVAGGVAVSLALVVLTGVGGARTSEPLDPDNPGPDGGRAVARVLADRGVDVQVARGSAQLRDADLDPAGTVLVTSAYALGRRTFAELRREAGGARVVVAGGGPGLTATVAPGLQPLAVAAGSGVDGPCDDPRLTGLTVEVDAALAYTPAAGDAACFPTDDGALLVEHDGVTWLGADELLANDHVLRADNAAIALRLLGADDSLVWYVPQVADLPAGDGVSIRTLLPPWTWPALLLAGCAALALMLWRGRRLGPLVVEPLPVVVRAIETTRSRGRLYRRSADRGHAAQVLRSGCRARVAERLRLGAGATAEEVARAAAAHAGHPEQQVLALLSPAAPAPPDDTALVHLADALAALEEEVRRP